MPKPVTKERLLRALASVQKRCKSVTERDGKIVRTLTMYGMRSLCHQAFGQEPSRIDYLRQTLDMEYVGAPKTEVELTLCVDRFQYNIERFDFWRELIYASQQRHEISGIKWTTEVVNGVEIEQPWVNEDLPLIPSDLSLLRSRKDEIISKFIIATQGISLWQRVEHDWIHSTPETLKLIATMFDWAFTFELGDEYLIDVGSGSNVDSGNIPRAAFCACESKPSM